MPAFSATDLKGRTTTFVTTATRAQDASRKIRAEAEQHIIDSECRATRLALARDKVAWRAYRRGQGQPAETFVPYLT